jgi:hypothetical protein
MAIDMKTKHPVVSTFPHTSGPDYKTAISEGRFEGYSLINKFAVSSNIDMGNFKILSNNSAIVHFITSERQMTIRAANAADQVAGTGAQLVVLDYYNEACELKSEVIELEADQATNTIATDIYRVEALYIIRYGSSGTHGEVGTKGNLLLTNLANTETYAQISAGSTFSENCIHWIRPGYRAVFSEVKAQCTAQDDGIDMGIFATFDCTGHGGGNCILLQCCEISLAWGNVAVVSIDPHFGVHNYSTDTMQAVCISARGLGADNKPGSASFVLYEFLPDY